MRAKKANAPLQPTRPQSPGPTNIIPNSIESVKPDGPNELRALRLSRHIPGKDMLAVVRTIYPKYDKTIQSKCEHGEDYGIQLRPDAMAALVAKFAPDLLTAGKRPSRDRHRLAHRISCRLPEAEFDLLQQRVRADGHTVQSWLTEVVRQYLNNGKELPT